MITVRTTGTKAARPQGGAQTAGKRAKLWRRIQSHWQIYLILIPVIVYYLVFAYAPMGGIILAFKNYSIKGGIWGSKWVGMQNFVKIFSDRYFLRSLRNTIVISVGGLAIGMFSTILLAIILSELRMNRSKKLMQTIITFPHFISWVVMAGIFFNLFASTGFVSHLVRMFGGTEVTILRDPSVFRWFIWLSDIWKEVGWGCIIYLAAIAGIDPGLYEAAMVDGASRLQRIWHVTLPGIRATFCTVLILDVGTALLNGRFDQIFNLYSAPVYETADTIDTFIFRQTFLTGDMNFGISTAIGLAKSLFGLVMVIISNTVVEKMGEQGVF